MTDLSLIIRFVGNPVITDMLIGDLKDYAAILFTENHNAAVYSICDALPVVMANVPVAETERIAAYEFVESIGDGNAKVYATMNVSGPAIRADDVESALGYNGSGIKIAILDSGINSSHPDLNDLDDKPATNDPKVILEVSKVDWDNDNVPDVDAMDYVGHGTHVAGIAAGTGEASNYKYKGTAPGAWLMNLKVLKLKWWPWGLDSDGRQDDVVNAIDYAISEGADVICMSLGWPGGDGTSESAKAANDAVDAGVVVVVGAGNDGLDGSGTIKTPGDASYVITVGAIDDNGTIDIGDDVLWQAWSSGF